MQNPRHIVITGASSGIGAALAQTYAASGVTLSLHGRDPERLGKIDAAARTKGALVTLGIGDVTDRDGMTQWLHQRHDVMPVDLLIANAGISAGTGKHGGESDEQAARIFAVNLDGAINTIRPLLPDMIARGRGQIALMSSLAGFRGLPGAPAYSASKAAVRVYGEALRGALSRYGLEVNVICPGYIATPMTAVNDFRMPFLMSPERAAAIIRRGLAQNKARIAFPWPTYAAVQLLAALPPRLTDWIVARLPEKP